MTKVLEINNDIRDMKKNRNDNIIHQYYYENKTLTVSGGGELHSS